MSINLKPLLTIAIPTYNRGIILDESLRKILPQIYEHKSEIEFIISDNASTDNTQEVIEKYKKKYSAINFITNLQSHNTGYFGNFKKCKRLSNGKYLWLLSDNEHILDGVIDLLITTIHSNKEDVGVFYLADISTNSLNKIENNTNTFKIFQSKFENLVKNESAYMLTLTSSVVFLNDKRFDDEVMSELNGNLFLGFIFLCNALTINDRITIINGKIYTEAPCNVYFDIFKAWTKDIMECVDYMVKRGILTEELKVQFIKGFLQTNVRSNIYNYRVYGSLHGKTYGSRKELKILLNSYYNKYPFYRKHIYPLFLCPKLIFKTYNFMRRKNWLKKRF